MHVKKYQLMLNSEFKKIKETLFLEFERIK